VANMGAPEQHFGGTPRRGKTLSVVGCLLVRLPVTSGSDHRVRQGVGLTKMCRGHGQPGSWCTNLRTPSSNVEVPRSGHDRGSAAADEAFAYHHRLRVADVARSEMGAHDLYGVVGGRDTSSL
jgi:hypothetical protein